MSDGGQLPRLFGYTSAFSACAGETLSFHVSGENVDRYVAQLVRLRHGYDGPGSLGLLETEIASEIDGPHPAGFHEARPGSSVVIDDPERRLMPEGELEFGVLLWATTPQSSAPQGLLGAWSEDDRAGYALYLLQGHVVLVVGDGGEAATLQIETPVRPRTWYAITAGLESDRAAAWVQQAGCDPAAGSLGLAPPTARRDASISTVPHSMAPFRIAALSRRAGDRWVASSHFNGKLEAPWVASASSGQTTRAAWRFELSSHPDGLLLDDVLDASDTGLHGRALGQPTRGVTGHNWSGTSDSYHQSPEEYGAIHFHEDDLADLEWPTAFDLEIPQGAGQRGLRRSPARRALRGAHPVLRPPCASRPSSSCRCPVSNRLLPGLRERPPATRRSRRRVIDSVMSPCSTPVILTFSATTILDTPAMNCTPTDPASCSARGAARL